MRRRSVLLTCFCLLLAGLGCDGRREAQESALRTNLKTLRELIEQYQGDHGQPPATLGVLVDAGYLRQLPYDPITRRNDSWIVRREPVQGGLPGGIVGVRSGATGIARDGTRYADW